VIVDSSEARSFPFSLYFYMIDREREFSYSIETMAIRETGSASARDHFAHDPRTAPHSIRIIRVLPYPPQHSSLYYTLSYYPSNIYSALKKHIVVTITSLGARRVYIYKYIYYIYIKYINIYIFCILLLPLFSLSSSLSSLLSSLSFSISLS